MTTPQDTPPPHQTPVSAIASLPFSLLPALTDADKEAFQDDLKQLDNDNNNKTFKEQRALDKERRQGLQPSQGSLDNPNMNRAPNTRPYEHAQVSLKPLSDDYIAASQVAARPSTPRRPGRRVCIVSQGPMDTTVHQFHTMIVATAADPNGDALIVMLTNPSEGPKEKCAQYWPRAGQTLELRGRQPHLDIVGMEDVALTGPPAVSSTNTQDDDDEKVDDSAVSPYIRRRRWLVRVVGTKRVQRVTQYHLINWMDLKLIDAPPVVDLLGFVHDHLDSQTACLPIIHCSWGVGRASVMAMALHLSNMLQEWHKETVLASPSQDPASGDNTGTTTNDKNKKRLVVDLNAEVSEFRFYRCSFMPVFEHMTLAVESAWSWYFKKYGPSGTKMATPVVNAAL